MIRGAPLTLLLMAAASSLQGQSDRWQRQVDSAADRGAKALEVDGYRTAGSVVSGELLAGETTTLTVPLSGAGSWAIIGVCDDDCGGLDLVLISPMRYEVDADRQGGVVPVVRTTTTAGGAFRVEVTMRRCRVSPCRYQLRVLRRSSDNGK